MKRFIILILITILFSCIKKHREVAKENDLIEKDDYGQLKLFIHELYELSRIDSVFFKNRDHHIRILTVINLLIYYEKRLVDSKVGDEFQKYIEERLDDFDSRIMFESMNNLELEDRYMIFLFDLFKKAGKHVFLYREDKRGLQDFVEVIFLKGKNEGNEDSSNLVNVASKFIHIFIE